VEAEEIARKVEYLELTIDPDFRMNSWTPWLFPWPDPFPHLKGL